MNTLQRYYSRQLISPVKWGFVASLLTFSLIFYSCHKPEVVHYTIGILKNQVSFKGTEKLLYLDQDNDTIILYGQGRKTTVIEQISLDESGITYEQDKTYFMSPDSMFRIFYTLESPPYRPHLSVELHKGSHYPLETELGCTYNIPLEIGNLNESQYRLDSVMILGNVYHEVFADTASYNVNAVVHHPTTLYQINNGVLQFTDINGISYNLIKVIWQ